MIGSMGGCEPLGDAEPVVIVGARSRRGDEAIGMEPGRCT
jgi:hypothetical protein